MTDDDFQGLFSADDAAELLAAATAAETEVAAEVAAKAAAEPLKEGIWYAGDEANENGHKISMYRLVMGGKVVMWAKVNTELTVSADDEPAVAGLPAGATAHRIVLVNATGTKMIGTKGFAVMAPHEDGTHIDGRTVRSFLIPRVARYLGELYGV